MAFARWAGTERRHCVDPARRQRSLLFDPTRHAGRGCAGTLMQDRRSRDVPRQTSYGVFGTGPSFDGQLPGRYGGPWGRSQGTFSRATRESGAISNTCNQAAIPTRPTIYPFHRVPLRSILVSWMTKNTLKMQGFSVQESCGGSLAAPHVWGHLSGAFYETPRTRPPTCLQRCNIDGDRSDRPALLCEARGEVGAEPLAPPASSQRSGGGSCARD